MTRTAFPWYDSPWLATYVRAKAWIARTHPARLAEFEARLAPLRTDPDPHGWPSLLGLPALAGITDRYEAAP